ncbi:MAG: VWA domain-containing protein [Verrucomicrobia bacterium]|nr:MAG: VWA domain-containing protein [Verrucomicrobiota bacterium]
MTFAYPWLLLLALLIPAALWLRHARPRMPTLNFSDGAALAKLPRSWAVRLQPALPTLFGIGLLCLVVALARPQKGLEESRVRTEVVDIVLLVDVSPSMMTPDFSTPTRTLNRLDAVKLVLDKFIQNRPHDRLGMIGFSAFPYTLCPLTLDHGWLLERMRNLRPGMLGDSTAIGDGMASAINRLRDSQAKSKVVVLLTDGMNNFGTLAPENAAQAAKALGIKIYTVGASGREAQYASAGEGVDEAALKRIAESTGATYFCAASLSGLQRVYEQIDRMEKTDIQVEHFTRYRELSKPWIIWALIFLGLEKWLALTRLGRLP